jgi:hypothetical protein
VGRAQRPVAQLQLDDHDRPDDPDTETNVLGEHGERQVALGDLLAHRLDPDDSSVD